ncbi:MAG: TlpA family protein disulfide reductase [Deltaproteobacteria bacterium]|nr:TlpA family protein disulfide reductase [Deltaproteobacteria bacterium]
MKKLLAILLFLSLSSCATQDGLEPGSVIGYMPLHYDSGVRGLLQQYRGKRVAILFWATWCNFSKPVIEDFNKVAAEHKDDDSIVFIAVSLDDNREEFDTRIRVKNLNNVIHVYSGNGPGDETYIRFGSPAVPKSFLIDPEGKIVFRGRNIKL